MKNYQQKTAKEANNKYIVCFLYRCLLSKLLMSSVRLCRFFCTSVLSNNQKKISDIFQHFFRILCLFLETNLSFVIFLLRCRQNFSSTFQTMQKSTLQISNCSQRKNRPRTKTMFIVNVFKRLGVGIRHCRCNMISTDG